MYLNVYECIEMHRNLYKKHTYISIGNTLHKTILHYTPFVFIALWPTCNKHQKAAFKNELSTKENNMNPPA